MNISSVIIHIKELNLKDDILQSLSQIQGCEIVAHENAKIVALISVEEFEDELRTFKLIEQINGVAGVAMVYSYQEDLDGDLEALQAKSELSDILTNDEMSARDIRYSGSIYHRTK